MSLLSYAKKAVSDPGYAVKEVYRSAVVGLATRYPIGTNIFSQDWDAVVLLDTCRVDALRDVADEYDFLPDRIDSIWSIGGTSAEWMALTFDQRYAAKIRNTAYIASNGHAKLVFQDGLSPREEERGPELNRMLRFDGWDPVSASDIGKLEHTWKYEPAGETGVIGHEEGHSPPRYVTDRAIAVGRNQDFDRLVLHYNQPHSPYVARAVEENRALKDYERTPMDYIRRTGDRQTVYQAYLEDLRYVLDDIQVLLENLDADRVMISADHGEAFGEWDIYGHHAGSLHPYIRRVPWVEVSGTDGGTYTPQFEPIETTERSVNEVLEALGYI